MSTTPAGKRPQVRGTVVLSLLVGALSIFSALGLLSLISDAEKGGQTVETWIKLTAYFNLGFGIVAILVALLLLMYKRIGLLLGLILYGLNLILIVLQVVTGSTSVSITLAISVVLNIAVLYYLFIYFTREPEKSFFT